MLASPVWASPFVVCSPYVTTVIQPDEFELIIDTGTAFRVIPETLTDGSKRLHYDVGSVTVGTHTINVKACSTLWGCSEAVPFQFTKSVPAKATAIGLVK